MWTAWERFRHYYDYMELYIASLTRDEYAMYLYSVGGWVGASVW